MAGVERVRATRREVVPSIENVSQALEDDVSKDHQFNPAQKFKEAGIQELEANQHRYNYAGIDPVGIEHLVVLFTEDDEPKIIEQRPIALRRNTRPRNRQPDREAYQDQRQNRGIRKPHSTPLERPCHARIAGMRPVKLVDKKPARQILIVIVKLVAEVPAQFFVEPYGYPGEWRDVCEGERLSGCQIRQCSDSRRSRLGASATVAGILDTAESQKNIGAFAECHARSGGRRMDIAHVKGEVAVD